MNRFNTPGPTFVPSLHLPPVYSLSRHTFTSTFISPRIRLLSRRSTAYQCPSFFIRASISPSFYAVLLCRSFLRTLLERGNKILDRFYAFDCEESWEEGISGRYIPRDGYIMKDHLYSPSWKLLEIDFCFWISPFFGRIRWREAIS